MKICVSQLCSQLGLHWDSMPPFPTSFVHGYDQVITVSPPINPLFLFIKWPISELHGVWPVALAVDGPLSCFKRQGSPQERGWGQQARAGDTEVMAALSEGQGRWGSHMHCACRGDSAAQNFSVVPGTVPRSQLPVMLSGWMTAGAGGDEECEKGPRKANGKEKGLHCSSGQGPGCAELFSSQANCPCACL